MATFFGGDLAAGGGGNGLLGTVALGGLLLLGLALGDGLGGVLLDQADHGVRRLGTHAGPVGQAILSDAQGLFTTAGQRVVEADALDETAIAAVALVGNHDVVERARLGAAAGESNDDHDLSFGWRSPKIGASMGFFG